MYTHVCIGISTPEMSCHSQTRLSSTAQLSLSGAVSRSVGPVSAGRWAMKKLFTLGPQYHGHSQVELWMRCCRNDTGILYISYNN